MPSTPSTPSSTPSTNPPALSLEERHARAVKEAAAYAWVAAQSDLSPEAAAAQLGAQRAGVSETRREGARLPEAPPGPANREASCALSPAPSAAAGFERAPFNVGRASASANAMISSPAMPQRATMPDLPTLRLKLQDARQEVRNLTVMAMRPDLRPATKDLVLEGLESARAEVKLRVKALRHAESLQAPSVRTEPPARPGARLETPAPPPPATSSIPSDDKLRVAILLGWQMAIAEAQRMLAMKTQQALSGAPQPHDAGSRGPRQA
jgi:hypothetical protein